MPKRVSDAFNPVKTHGWCQVGIAHGGSNVGMPQPLLNLGQWNAVHHPLRCKGVTQIMNANAGNAGVAVVPSAQGLFNRKS